jgi:hypothetical protein
MFVEHQSTSDTKIERRYAAARGLLLDFSDIIFTF